MNSGTIIVAEKNRETDEEDQCVIVEVVGKPLYAAELQRP